jgi:hypothetical protein
MNRGRIWRANNFFQHMFWSWYGLVFWYHIMMISYDDIHVDIDFSSAQVTLCWSSGKFFSSPYSWPASWPGLGAGIGQWLRPPGLQLQSKKPIARQGVPGSSAGLWPARIFGQTVYSHNIAYIYIYKIDLKHQILLNLFGDRPDRQRFSVVSMLAGRLRVSKPMLWIPCFCRQSMTGESTLLPVQSSLSRFNNPINDCRELYCHILPFIHWRLSQYFQPYS